MIGDAALLLSARRHAYPHVTDLGEAWKAWTGLPFVFAVWAARRAVDRQAVRDVHRALLASRKWGLAHLGDLAERASEATGVERGRLPRVPGGARLRPLVPAPGRPHRFPAPARGARRGAGRHALLPGSRLTVSEATELLELYERAPLVELGALADAERRRRHPDGIVTYIVDRNINYTNVCVADCKFCAFYRRPKHAGGLHPVVRGDRPEDRRGQGDRRGADPDAGRAQPVHPVRVVPRPAALHQAGAPDPRPRLLAVGGAVLRPALPDVRGPGGRGAPAGGARLHPGRRRRDPGGPGAEAWSRRRRR